MAPSTKTPRELITPHKGDSRYQRREDNGQFAEADKVSRSQTDDKAHRSKTVAKPGQGDRGDHKKR